jgi:ankyrin repeat protein
MADQVEQSAPAGAPSDVLMALYTGDRDTARALASQRALTLPELAAMGDLFALAQRVADPLLDLQEYSPDGWTALHLAGHLGYASIVVRLLRAGASHAALSHNAQGNTALHATLAGRSEIAAVSALLVAGSDPAAADAHGYTPLHLAASRGEQAIAELLVVCGADDAATAADGRTPADLARERGHEDLAEWLARP